jgi:DNA-binding transcriptional LysR family regulator
MQDLNDFYFFHAVVTHGGFSAAARRIGVPKGTLSKHVAKLEERLGVRLLERSTRRLRTTEVGRGVYEQCQSVLAGVEAAEAVAAQAQAEPQGIVRVSCPQGLIQDLIADLLPSFMERHPKLRVQLKVINRRVDLIEDDVDIALRARTSLDSDPSLIVRKLGLSRLALAISPGLLASFDNPPSIDDLEGLPTLSMTEHGDEDCWELVGADGTPRRVSHRPRLSCSNFDVLRKAAIDGLGIALLPEHICGPCFRSGELVHLLPEWHTQYGVVHAVFTSRKGLMPSVRMLIDYLAAEVPRKVGQLA